MQRRYSINCNKKKSIFSNGKDNPWSFTIIRRNKPNYEKRERNPYYTYLAPIDAENNQEKESIKFLKDELPLIPKQNNAYKINTKSGTLIKCYEYETKRRSNILLAGEFLIMLKL